MSTGARRPSTAGTGDCPAPRASAVGASWARLRRACDEHRDFLLLALLAAAFRAMALLLFRPGGWLFEWWGYYLPNVSFVSLSDQGYYPFVHYWMEYPPLFPWLAVGAYRLSLLLPAWTDPRLWYNTILGGVLLPFEVANLALVYAIALRLGDRQRALRSAVFYACLFFPVLAWMSWMDCFSLFFLLLALYLILLRRPAWAGLVTGVGFMVKLMPVLLIPIGLRVFSGVRRKAIYLALAAAAVALIAAPFLLTRADLFLASFVNIATRSSWETVWALLDGYYTGGVVAPLELRFDPAAAGVPTHPSQLPWPLITAGFGLIYLVAHLREREWAGPHRIVAFAGLTLSLFLLYSKGYSPQFLVYLLPFIVLLLPNARGVAYALLFTLTNLLEWPVAQLVLPDHRWLFAGAVVFRALLLLGLVVEWFPAALPWLRTAILRLLLVTSLVGGLAAGVGALQAFRADRLAQDPYREVIGFLAGRPRPGVVVVDASMYGRLYPYRAPGTALRLLEDDERSVARLADLAARRDLIWVVDLGTEAGRPTITTVERWLSDNTFPLRVHWFENARLSAFATGSEPPSRPHQAALGGQVELVGYSLAQGVTPTGTVVRLRLGWRALQVMDRDYTVFVHAIGPDGQLVGQRDGQPAGGFRPTSSWAPGEPVRDGHALLLEPGLPPGEIRIVVGLYDATTGQRLPVLDEAGQEQGDAVVLPDRVLLR